MSRHDNSQYTLGKIIAVWAAAAVPMGLLAWVVTPRLIPHFSLPAGIIYWLMMLVGLAWQCALSLLIVYREEGSINWATLQERMWYKNPRDPKTGEYRSALLWWVAPFLLLRLALLELTLPDVAGSILPFLKTLPRYSMQELATPDYEGAWWLLGLMVLHIPLNYFLGEEFLHRGVLLPKMKGVFGKWDWFANGLLFGLYHLHKPQIIMGTALFSGVVFSFPSRRFRCNWMAVIVHGSEGVFFFLVVLGIILGFV